MKFVDIRTALNSEGPVMYQVVDIATGQEVLLSECLTPVRSPDRDAVRRAIEQWLAFWLKQNGYQLSSRCSEGDWEIHCFESRSHIEHLCVYCGMPVGIASGIPVCPLIDADR